MISLYIKAHRVTGLKYFGKTQQRDAAKYKGSGKRWLRHLAKHGNEVDTIVVATFEDDDVDKATEFSINFSIENDIVNSNEWANLMIECGVGGRAFGSTFDDPLGIVREKLSDASTKMWQNDEKRKKLITSQSKSWTEERKEHQRSINRKAWTDERKKKHSLRLTELHVTGQVNANSILIPKTVAHKKAIAAALRGKEKPLSHRLAQAWSKIGGAKGFTNYFDYAKYCYEQYQLGLSGTKIAVDTDTGNNAVYKAIKVYPDLLKKADE